MSRTEDVDNAIWSDPDISALSAYAKLVYIWTFTNPCCGWAGVYKMSERQIGWELNLDAGQVHAALDELAGARLVTYEDQVLWVRSRVKHIRSKGPQMAKSIAKDIAKLDPDNGIRERFLHTYGHQPWLRDALSSLLDETTDPRTYRDSGYPIDPIDPVEPLEVPGTGTGEGSSCSVVRTTTDLGSGVDAATVRRLFDYWRERCGHPNAKATKERLEKIRARLREGYTEQQIMDAIDGAAIGAFISDNGKRHDDIELICRNGSKLESFIGRTAPTGDRQQSTRDRVIAGQNTYKKYYNPDGTEKKTA